MNIRGATTGLERGSRICNRMCVLFCSKHNVVDVTKCMHAMDNQLDQQMSSRSIQVDRGALGRKVLASMVTIPSSVGLDRSRERTLSRDCSQAKTAIREQMALVAKFRGIYFDDHGTTIPMRAV